MGPVKLQQKADVKIAVADSYRSLLECLERMPDDFDTIMRDASTDLAGEHRRGLRPMRLNPIALQPRLIGLASSSLMQRSSWCLAQLTSTVTCTSATRCL